MQKRYSPLWFPVILSSLFLFAAGYLSGYHHLHTKLPGWKLFKTNPLTEQNSTSPTFQKSSYAGMDSAILAQAFPLTQKGSLYQGPLLNPEVSDVQELQNQIDSLLIPDASEIFPAAYVSLQLTGYTTTLLPETQEPIAEVHYALADKPHISYAYLAKTPSSLSKTAILIIPGSGHNQSSPILRRNPKNSQYPILDLTRQTGSDVFIYVKPNQDFLAIHHHGIKLHFDFITHRLINLGGSYSAKYLIDTLAMVKHLKQVYPKVILVGLSQGGEAVLWNALQSEPDGAFIASGFSVLREHVTHKSPDQILIPEIDRKFTNSPIREMLAKSKTQWFFTYGLQEQGVYQVEANENSSANYFENIPQVKVRPHPGGHHYPVEFVREFLASF